MKPNIVVTHILSVVTVIIGLYMLFAYMATSVPPMLSGIAFILIGIATILGHVNSK